MKRIQSFFLISMLFVMQSEFTYADGQKHLVKKGDTLYSLARQYGKTVQEIAKANSMGANDGIKIGQVLLIPSSGGSSKVSSPAAAKPVKSFTPKPVPSTPDTPYRDEDTKPRNEAHLTQTEMQQDESVIAAIPPVATSGLKTTSTNPADYPGVFTQYPNQGFKIVKQRGTANYLTDATSGNQFLAFYNHAETGSVIRVTNMLNHKTIFVKVMGKVPLQDAKQDIALKLTASAAEELGAQEEKFLVEVAAYSAN